jgi:hypothetical protein
MRLCLIVLTVGILAPAAISATHPQVRFADLSPMTVRGSAFHPAERVTVTLSVGKRTAEKTVRATQSGGFTVHFAMRPTGCGRLAISARGSLGSTASWKAPPLVCGTSFTPSGD